MGDCHRSPRLDYGTHPLRRTKAALIYKQAGDLRAVQILLDHTKIETTARYLDVEVEDALALAEATEIERKGLPVRQPTALPRGRPQLAGSRWSAVR
jgi:integrase